MKQNIQVIFPASSGGCCLCVCSPITSDPKQNTSRYVLHMNNSVPPGQSLKFVYVYVFLLPLNLNAYLGAPFFFRSFLRGAVKMAAATAETRARAVLAQSGRTYCPSPGLCLQGSQDCPCACAIMVYLLGELELVYFCHPPSPGTIP